MSSSLRPLTTLLVMTLLGVPLALQAAADERANEAKKQVYFGIEVAQRGLWREAIYRWEKAVELDPRNASARNNLAVAYEQAGQFDEANVEYERALEIDPNNLYIRQNYELFREAYERKKRTDQRSGTN
ncbi:MAG TPA: tetratricopeptide repeat protein [Vicinamibacteria bacterium]|nr:tetratricopeptide repeat protein [Vicinamibacteria bacterium]